MSRAEDQARQYAEQFRFKLDVGGWFAIKMRDFLAGYEAAVRDIETKKQNINQYTMATIQIPKKVVTESIEMVEVELPYFLKYGESQYWKIITPNNSVKITTLEGVWSAEMSGVDTAFKCGSPITREEFEAAASKVLHKLSGLIIND
jgi:hypothetical protein